MAKKMNNYLKFPLMLGLVGLVCGGALAGVYALTNPVIEENNNKKANDALYNILGRENVKNVESDVVSIETTNIISVSKVTLNSDRVVYYYNLVSARGYSGTVNFAIVFGDDGIMGYQYISGTEDTLGLNVARDNKAWSDSLANYDPNGGAFNFTGGSAAATIPAMKAAVDIAYADFMAKKGVVVDTSLIKISGGLTNFSTLFNRWTYELTAVNSQSGYGLLTLEVRVILDKEDVNVGTVERITVKSYGGSTEDYGVDLLEKGNGGQLNAAAQTFYDTYVKIPSGGLPISLFVGDNAADVQKDGFDGNNAIFQTGASFTARSFYAIVQRAIVMAQNNEEGSLDNITTIGHLQKTEGAINTYRIQTTNSLSGYGSLLLEVQVNTETRKVMDVKVYHYVDTTYGYGYALINDLESSHVSTNGDTFYDTYINIPSEGLDFDIFKTYDLSKPSDDSNTIFRTGATYTTKAYYAAVQKAVTMAETNDAGAEIDMVKNSYVYTIEKKSGDDKIATYHIELINALDTLQFSKFDGDITLDLENDKVTAITYTTTDLGTEGYGKDLFEGTKMDQASQDFYNTYVKLPDGGIDFNTFRDYIPYDLPPFDDEKANIANSTGATYSANNYVAAVNFVILYAEEGN